MGAATILVIDDTRGRKSALVSLTLGLAARVESPSKLLQVRFPGTVWKHDQDYRLRANEQNHRERSGFLEA